MEAGRIPTTRSKRRAVAGKVRAVVDVLLVLDLIAVMATALVEEAPHEYLGIAFVVLAIVHAVLNRRWFAALPHGRWTAARVLQTVAVVGLLACAIGQAASAVVLSKHALWFLPALPGASWARSMHMLCSYWAFVFGFAHVGIQLRSVVARTGALRRAGSGALWVLRAVWLVVAACGAWSFVQLGLADYLLANVRFAAADHGASVAYRLGQYASIAALVAGAFHYLRMLLDRLSRARSSRR